MKTKHRRELKENDVVRLVAATREFGEQHGKQITAALVAVIVIVLGVMGVLAFRNRQQSQGQDLLAQAMVVLNTAVVPVDGDDQSWRCAGRGRNRREGHVLDGGAEAERRAAEAEGGGRRVSGDAGRHPGALPPRGHPRGARSGQGSDHAIRRCGQRAGGDSLYGQMAQLGKADAQAQAGEIDSAIATWKELAAKKDAKLPEDAILMQLGRAYQAKGNTAEARKTFTDIVDNHPDSPYVADARKELESLKG